jgi:hypothetical protein
MSMTTASRLQTQDHRFQARLGKLTLAVVWRVCLSALSDAMLGSQVTPVSELKLRIF